MAGGGGGGGACFGGFVERTIEAGLRDRKGGRHMTVKAFLSRIRHHQRQPAPANRGVTSSSL